MIAVPHSHHLQPVLLYLIMMVCTVSVCVCVCAYVHAFVRACVCVCVRSCVRDIRGFNHLKDSFIGLFTSFFSLPTFQLSEVVIGYDPTDYSVDESAGSLTLTARVLQGELRRSVSVLASTRPGSAAGL